MEFGQRLTSMLTEAQEYSTIAYALLDPAAEKVDSQFGDYFDYEGGGMISFMPKGRVQLVLPDGSFDAKGRQKATPGRVVRQIIPMRPRWKHVTADTLLHDHHIEDFTNAIRALDEQMLGRFEIVSGEELRFWYHEDNYCKRTHNGDLDSSCMRHDYAQQYLDIYVRNPDQVKCVVLLRQEESVRNKTMEWRLHGRALLWELDNGSTAMDRVYATGPVRLAFRNFAKKNGWVYMPNGNASVTLDNVLFPYYPSVDTFAWVNTTTKKIYSRRGGLYSTYGHSTDLFMCGTDLFMCGTEGDDYELERPRARVRCDVCEIDFEAPHRDTPCRECQPCIDCGKVRSDQYEAESYCTCVLDKIEKKYVS